MTAKILYPSFELTGRKEWIAREMAFSAHPAEGLLASFFNRYIANEHQCAMPDGRKSWYALTGLDQVYNADNYVCAECGVPWSRHHG